MKPFSQEVDAKIGLVRQALEKTGAKAARFSGTDWFSWITAGASHTVLLTSESGIAEVLITSKESFIITDEIEISRLSDEEIPQNFKMYAHPWADLEARASFIKEVSENGRIFADRPKGLNESLIPADLLREKRILNSDEIARYRLLGKNASQAMTEVMQLAKPDWTEFQLAGAGAEALWSRGIHPTLTLVAGERRLPLYRHATASSEKLGSQAMLVFCARQYGLFANFTRFVSFSKMDSATENRHLIVREIEAEALSACKPGAQLSHIYTTLKKSYEKKDFARAIYEHHQGGTTGYLSREIVATPSHTADIIEAGNAVAWNPSIPGAKIEDTFLVASDGNLENLTFDEKWPSVTVSGRSRALPLIR